MNINECHKNASYQQHVNNELMDTVEMQSKEKSKDINCDWWEANLTVVCIHCNVETIVIGKQGKFQRWNCSSYCLLAKPCYTPEDNFSDVYCVSTTATLIKCPKCDKHLRCLLCCKQYLPFDATDNVLKCLL